MVRMKKEGVLKRIVLTIVLAVGMLSWMGMVVKAEEDQTEVSTWSELCSALKIDGANIKLTANVTYGEGDGANKSANLEIPDDTTVTLDLSGCTIDRGLANSDAVWNGCVIMVYGNLTINDSSDQSDTEVYDGTGTITGGNNAGDGGGIYNNGTLTLNGGTIKENATSYGGGIFNIGTLKIVKGTITGNNASEDGGGVYNEETFIMTGGTITGNNAGEEGGGVYNRKIFEMTGGTITGNNADENGGGVLNGEIFEMTGGTITGNNAGEEGGGVCDYGSIQIGGSPIITGNVIGGELNNGVYTGVTTNNCNLNIRDDNDMITVKEALGTDANIGITLENPDLTTPFAEADSSYNDGKLKDVSKFVSDDTNYYSYLDGDGKAVLRSKNKAYSWDDLKDKLSNASSDSENPTKIQLGNNITYTGENTAEAIDASLLLVPEDTYVVLDLNGYTIDRGLSNVDAVENGFVIMVYGNLTINDSSDQSDTEVYDGTGTITGGNNAYDGGGIYNKGTLTLNGGTIKENATSYGGGICNSGTLKIVKGTITGNNASKDGGGVYNVETFIMTGGTITGNNAKGYGGGVYNREIFEMTGGTITGNNTEGEGGGVYNVKTFEMTGGTITGNNADENGGGVYNTLSLKIKGSPVIKDNVKGGRLNDGVYTGGVSNNCSLDSSPGILYGKITVIDTLEDGAEIGVTPENNFAAVFPFAEALTGDTSYNSGKLSADDIKHFTSDDNNYTIYLNDDGKAIFWDKTKDYIWECLRDKLVKASSDSANPTKITLDSNLTYTGAKTAEAIATSLLLVPSGKYVVLDLNGYTIDRGLSNVDAVSNGFVIKVYGNLTINDSSDNPDTDAYDGTGTITGGNNADKGGGINISYGTVTLNGGTIKGNFAIWGGGINNDEGNLKVINGTITGNNASKCGGGVYNKGTFIMTGGTITGNNAKIYGGGVYEETGTFTMTGGNITGNNTEGEGGGVHTGSTIQVSGSPIIKDNVKGGHLEGEVYTGGTTNNCDLYADSITVYGKIIVTGALENDAKIGVTFKELETTTPFAEALTGDTSYNSGKLSADDIKHFTSDDTNYTIYLNDDGKAIFGDKTKAYSWDDLKDKLSNASSDSANPTKLTLNNNITYTGAKTAEAIAASLLEVPEDTYVVLDLNGYTIDRGLSNVDAVSKGSVISAGNNVYLTIIDSSDSGTGTITGGNTLGNGGGISVESGTVTLSGGTIKGNSAAGNGGGIRVEHGDVILNGGTIIDNFADGNGGGIYNHSNKGGSDGMVKIVKVTISGNKCGGFGGGVHMAYAPVEITGGTIKGNNAAKEGGGIFCSGIITMTGGSIIGNNAGEEDGGYSTADGKLLVKGSPVIKDNVIGGQLDGDVYKGGTTSNCCVNYIHTNQTDNNPLTVIGVLEDDAKIGITNHNIPYPFAIADASYNGGKLSEDDLKHFTSDSDDYKLVLNSDGQAFTKKLIIVSGITAKSKVYDGNKVVELDTSKATFKGMLEEEELTITETGTIEDTEELTVTATGTFDDANAGKNKTVTITGLTLGGNVAYKYIIAEEEQETTVKADIEAKPATITADTKSKAYGEADPTLTATVSGVVEGETLDYTLARAEGENIGDYDIDVTLGDNPNYEVTTQKGKLTITKAEVAPDKPDYSTKNVEYVIAMVSDVELPANWAWAEADKDKELRVGEALTATAEYIGEDKDNYVDEAKSVTVSITRNACTHATKQKKEAVDATCLKAGNSAYWYCPVCNRYYSDAEATTEITENSWVKQALGHSYGAPTYTWSSDNKTCTATAVCKNEGCTDEVEGHTVTETVNTASAVKTDSTTEKKGVTTYTAIFTNKLFEKQSKDVEDIPLKEKQETPEEQKSNDQKPAETTTTTTQDTPAVVEKGQTVTVENKGTFEVTSEASATTNTVEFTAVADMKAKNVTIPDTVTLGGKKYTVTKITANAFKGSAATTVTLGKNINKIAPNAFKGSKVKVVTLKSKKLTKNSVKNALKGSKAKTVTFKVKVGSKKENKKYVKKYKKFFTKKNVGKKVTVK